ncbi:flagellin [Paracoccaceae bacterium Fryx2]|nr:flagellin [Paracoccaceae bacterium Fryx2]
MSSILTNTSAMVALQSMKSINKNLNTTQSHISTGKAVSTAKDNAAVWAISKVMESDVAGFKGIGDSLSLGSSTISVARKAAETVTGLLTEIKGKVVAAQEENVDRNKIQTDIVALRDQIASVVGAAQFNGQNMIKGTDDMKVLASLDRSGDRNVTASSITVERQDLTTGAGKFGIGTADVASYGTITAPGGTVGTTGTTTAAAGKAAEVTFGAPAAANDVYTINVKGNTLNFTAAGAETADQIRDHFTGAINALGLKGVTAAANGSGVMEISNTNAFESVSVSLASTVDANLEMTDINGSGAAPTAPNVATIEQRAETIDFSTTAGVKDGDSFKVNVGSQSFDYIAGKGESMEDVVKGLKIAIDSNPPAGVTTSVSKDATTGAWSLSVDDATGGRTLALHVAKDGEASGGLFGLDNIDVTTADGAKSALANVETMINRSIDSAAAFGSAQKRIEIQNDFVSDLSDALKAGIGSMVDANMEETAARLQALQVQQQLGTQALSIANQAPQNVLALFR